MTSTNALILRPALPSDADALELLAELDSAPALRGDILVAEVGGELLAAVSRADGRAVADPFHPTSDLVWLLRERVRSRQRDGLLPARREALGGRARRARPLARLLRA
jgi:hypothetical protein